MKRYSLSLAFGMALMLCGCSVLRQSRVDPTEGIYHLKSTLPFSKVYLKPDSQQLQIYPLTKNGNSYKLDTVQHPSLALSVDKLDTSFQKLSLRQSSFDADFLTIAFKYRPVQQGFPRQFTTSLNGALFFGYRTDIYKMRYKTALLGETALTFRHLGFSIGGFSGFGGTTMNPWVTNYGIDTEYDGLIWSKGVAGIIAINSFTAGIGLGWDQLLDPNKRFWLYQHKPWLGLVFGLNLN